MNIQQIWLSVIFVYIGCIKLTDSQQDHSHHLKEQAPTDATFSERYHRLLHSHSPFGVLSKYFLRNRAQEEGHARKRRQITSSMQQLIKLSEHQQQQQSQFKQQNEQVQRTLFNEAKARQTRQPQVYSGGFSSCPRHFQKPLANYYQGALSLTTKSNKLALAPLAQYNNDYGFHGKPDALNNYYKKKAKYYRRHGSRKQQQYQQFKPYSSFGNISEFGRINKKHDASRQRENVPKTRPPKRKFRPSNVQS